MMKIFEVSLTDNRKIKIAMPSFEFLEVVLNSKDIDLKDVESVVSLNNKLVHKVFISYNPKMQHLNKDD